MDEYDEDWGPDDDEDEYDIIERHTNSYTDLKTVDFQYNCKTPIWIVLEEVSLFFESLDVANAVIYHLSTSEFDDGDCCMTVVYSV